MEGDGSLDQVRGGRRGGIGSLGSSARGQFVLSFAAEFETLPGDWCCALGLRRERFAGRRLSCCRAGMLGFAFSRSIAKSSWVTVSLFPPSLR